MLLDTVFMSLFLFSFSMFYFVCFMFEIVMVVKKEGGDGTAA